MKNFYWLCIAVISGALFACSLRIPRLSAIPHNGQVTQGIQKLPPVYTSTPIEATITPSPTTSPTPVEKSQPSPTETVLPTVTEVFSTYSTEISVQAPERLRFEWGTTQISLRGKLEGNSENTFLIKLVEGELLTVNLFAAINVVEMLVTGLADGSTFDIDTHAYHSGGGSVPLTQDYEIRIYNSGLAPQPFTLLIDIPKKIEFENGDGSRSLQGRLYGDDINRYYFQGFAGQTVTVRTVSPEDTVWFTLVSSEGQPMARSHFATMDYSGLVRVSGEFWIYVTDYSTINFPVDYSLIVSLSN